MPVSLFDIVAAHRAGKSPAETIRETYVAIAAWNDPALFITLRPEADALAAAEALDPADAARLPLFGVPYAVKDNIDVAGLPTTAACPAFAYMPAKDAFVVARLNALGAIPIGKTNLDQFATGLVGVRSPHGTPRNAFDSALIPGGSSSGSASAVAAGLVPFALGTDTAGSGRVPALLQRIVGLKPSLGALSCSGVVPACRTLDCVSIFARSVSEARAVFAHAVAYDAADPYARPLPAAPVSRDRRVGIPSNTTRRFLGDAEAEAAFERACIELANSGAKLVEIDFEPFFDVAAMLYDGPWVAERYAAIRAIIEAMPEALYPVTRSIIEGARKWDAAATFDAYYRLAELKRAIEPVWQSIDILAVPTTATVLTPSDVAADPVGANSKLGLYTNFTNLLDLCALAVPMMLRRDGKPFGLTFIAPSGADDFIGDFAMSLEAPTTATALETLEIAVVGAHLTGLPLNRQLTDLGATFVRATETSNAYRLYRLPGGPPHRPGLMRGAAGSGARIALEIWALPLSQVGAFLKQIPSPLGLGTVELADGGKTMGFMCENAGLAGAEDITGFGGWRAYLASLG